VPIQQAEREPKRMAVEKPKTQEELTALVISGKHFVK
jgi:hypothetical protein